MFILPSVHRVNLDVSSVASLCQLIALESFAQSPPSIHTSVKELYAIRGSVPVHTDISFHSAEMVAGLVLRSDGHSLYTLKNMSPNGQISLECGDVYFLDPSVPHGTLCPFNSGQLIFTAQMIRPSHTDAGRIGRELRDSLMRRVCERLSGMKVNRSSPRATATVSTSDWGEAASY